MAQIKKKFIGANQVDETKIRLSNDSPLKARNAADSADVNIVKVNASDKVEMSSFFETPVAAPTTDYQVANKKYVDDSVSGATPTAADVSYDPTASGLTATNVQDAIDEVEGRVDSAESAITDAQGDIADLVSLSGVAANSTTLGTFTGTTIPDSQTIKQALQALETSVETKAASSVVSEIDQNVDDLISLSGVAENSANLGTFTGSTIPDSQTVKQALQALETATELRALDSAVIKKDGSVAFTADQSMGGFKLTNVATPTLATDAAPKGYVDAVAQGLKPKTAVRAATLVAGTLATSFEDGDTIDGVVLAEDDRILIKDQAAPEENGIYIVQASGAPVRAPDFDSLSPIDEINGAYTFIQEGSQAGQGWAQQGAVAVLDTDPVVFVYFSDATSSVGGDMITKTGNTFSVDLASDAGLESSNPGNVAGQLRVKLDGGSLARSSSGLKVASGGITETEINASAISTTGALDGGSGTKLSVKVDAATIKKNGSNLLEGLKHREQKITLSGTDITNQYVDLAVAIHGVDAANNSASLFAVGGPMQEKAVDYTVSLTGGAGGVTRITFAGDLATAGASELIAGDKLVIAYDYLT
jgi:hypothetical protein